MDIRLCRGYWCIAGLIAWLFSLWVVVVYPFFITSNNTIVKNLSVFAVRAIVHTWKNAFPDLLVSIHKVPNLLAFKSFPMLLNAWKWLIEQFSMILQILLAFDTDLHRVMLQLCIFNQFWPSSTFFVFHIKTITFEASKLVTARCFT